MKEKRGSFETSSVVRLILGAKNILRRYSSIVQLLSFVCSTEGKGSQPCLWNIQNLGAVLRNKSCAACETNITLVATTRVIDPSLAQKSCIACAIFHTGASISCPYLLHILWGYTVGSRALIVADLGGEKGNLQ